MRFYLVSFLILLSTILIADLSEIIETIENGDLQQAETLLENEIISDRNLESWRQLGFSYKENNEIEIAIFSYQKIYNFNNDDYDATLALARLYSENQQYDLSHQLFLKILESDVTDVEAYLGLARTEKARENYSESISYYNSALEYLPDYLPALFELANVYIYSDKLNNAINIYQRILEIDNSWAEAWSGIGKMYWWQDKPFLALKNYEKAIQLDPKNMELIQEFENIKNDVGWNISAKFFGQSELEEGHDVNSFNQQYSISKRLTDKFSINSRSLWQYAQKDENDFKTEKYYDATFLKSNFKITSQNEINFTFAGSISDSTLTVIDGGWRIGTKWKNFQITNDLNFASEYFYHWERVWNNYFNEQINIKFKKLHFSGNYKLGKVEKNWIWQKTTQRENQFLNYNMALSYQLWSLPDIKIGTSYRFMDYQYNSSLYYSPIDRKIWGLSSSIYYPFKSVYLYLGGGINLDNYDEFETNIDTEFGISVKKLSLSISFSNFKNQYYESKVFALIIGGSF